jgi:excisionase family DNA binding protein
MPRRTPLITIAEAAVRLNVSERTIHRAIRDGSLPARRVRKMIRLDPADVDRLAVPIPTAGDVA